MGTNGEPSSGDCMILVEDAFGESGILCAVPISTSRVPAGLARVSEDEHESSLHPCMGGRGSGDCRSPCTIERRCSRGPSKTFRPCNCAQRRLYGSQRCG